MIIALTGKIGSGKSTVASELVRQGFTLVKFATPLKNMLRAIGLSDRELEGDLKETSSRLLCYRTPRYAMQTLGTEWGRDLIGKTFWTSLWEDQAVQHKHVVCDDCRFPDEAEVVRLNGGFVWRIERSGVADSHISEKQDFPADAVLINDSTVKGLLATARAILSTQSDGGFPCS